MGCARIHLYTRFDQVPGEDVLGTFRGLVRQAAQGVPIAYLTGTKEFFSLPFEVTPDVLIPRPETEILVERALSVVRGPYEGRADVLDLGTGSGCIAVSLARHLPEARIFASDSSEAALAVAGRNAERHGVAERIEFRLGDLFAPWTDNEPARFDVIVCNPPYVATEGAPVDESVRRYEPAGALFAGRDGLDVIRRVLAEAPGHLRAGGHLLVEMAYDQAPAARQLLNKAAWQEATTYRDGAGHERVLHVRRAPDGAAQVA
jgi:release factor glutamine methyltransferase